MLQRHTGRGQPRLSMSTAATEPVIGVINAGSSSIKFSFYEGERRILGGQVHGIGAHPSASATGPNGEKLDPPDLGKKPPTVPSEVLPAILPWAREKLGDRRLDALGQHVVHGGLRHSRPARVTPELLAELETWCRSRHCTSRTTSRRSRWRCASTPNCRRWRALIPPFTAPRRRSSRPSRSPTRFTRKA